MKRENKKLLGIAAVGLSAWLLVAALVLSDNSTQAMLRNEPIPSQEQDVVTSNDSQPRTLGADTDENNLRTASASDRPMVANEAQAMSATAMQAPATTLAHDGPHHESEEAHAVAGDIAKKSGSLPVFVAIAGATLLILGGFAAVIYFRRKKAPTPPQKS